MELPTGVNTDLQIGLVIFQGLKDESEFEVFCHSLLIFLQHVDNELLLNFGQETSIFRVLQSSCQFHERITRDRGDSHRT